MLIALHTVVCLVDGQVREFHRGDTLPELADDEATRLVDLGAAREALNEGKGKTKKKARGTGDSAEAGPDDDPPA